MEKTICIFGDSITWGAWDQKNGGWVTRLRRFFETSGDYIAEIYNQGVPDDSTDDLLKRFKVECAAREPNIIIFAIGTNDSQYIKTSDNSRVPLKKFKNNLVKLIREAKKFSNKIIFVGLTKADEKLTMPIPWAKEKFYDNDNITKYNSIIKKVSTKHGLPFIDMFDLLSTKDIADGLHPNSGGHKKMFLRIKNFLLTNKIV